MQARQAFRLRWIKVKRNKNGTRRVYVHQPGRKPIRLPDLAENDPVFIAAYAEAIEAAESERTTASGTIEAVALSYQRSKAWVELRDSSKEQRGREVARLVAKVGEFQISSIMRRHVMSDLLQLTPGAASNRLRAWRALIAHAIDLDLIEVDVTAKIKSSPRTKGGHLCWTHDEIEAFRAHWPVGSEQRRVMEITYWTGARRSDVVKLGRQHVDSAGWLTFKQTKTDDEVSVPLFFLPESCGELASDHGHVLSAIAGTEAQLQFITTKTGTPRSEKALSAWFGYACKAVDGLRPDLNLHGLRKARAVALRELGWDIGRIGAWTGHTTLREIVHYTRTATNKRMIGGGEQRTNVGTRPQFRVVSEKKSE